MKPELFAISFDGRILRRGFWLYVWEITNPAGDKLYYVGRTGDSSSTNAQSPFNRMSQHLGFSKNSNMLRRHLEAHNFDPELCSFSLIAVGPVEEESQAETRHEHDERRDRVAAMEMALADSLQAAGCRVMNSVVSRKTLDCELFRSLRAQFATALPQLAENDDLD